MPSIFKPTKAEIQAAAGKTVPDVIAPGLYSGAVGHHFARPGNRFWPALHEAGFTEWVLSPSEEGELLKCGWGITNLVERATASADELAPQELVAGGLLLEAKIRRYRPKAIAFLGIGAYRGAFHRPEAAFGRQPERLGNASIWVLPNPSGLNAHYTLKALAQALQALRQSTEGE
ncbi:MAG: G/U mismatch-specific DNA glycosylase [Chloroflexi bacterium]|nr:G/U mismatch-specific DNA glycosylase [Chloroflexota bacterium]